MQSEEEFYLSQIPKQQTPRTASKVSTVLNRVLQQKGYAALQSTELLRDAWERAVGSETAKLGRVGNVQRGALQIYVSSPIAKNELEFAKSAALRYMQANLPEFKIRTIRILLQT